MEFLRDTGWQAVIGLLGIVVAVVTYLLSRSKKRLVYYVLTETSLLSVNDEVKGKIKITYEKKDIQNLTLVILRLENRGNVHIASSDFEQKPIIFSFPDSEILSAEVTNVSPKNLKPVIQTDASNVTVEPLLLNKNDSITFKLVFSKYDKKVNVDGRIIGVKEIEKIEGGRNSSVIPPWVILVLLVLMFVFSLVLGFLFLLLILSKEPPGGFIAAVVLTGLVAAGLVGVMYDIYDNLANLVKSNRQK